MRDDDAGGRVASGGTRLDWAELPAPLRAALEGRLGARVVAAASQPGGFSPGLAARLTLADGRRAFVKAISAAQTPLGPVLHRAEARVAAALPPATPAPRLRWALDHDGWVALCFEDVDGRHPAQPWRQDELDLVLDAAGELAASLTPAPAAVAARPVGTRLAAGFGRWRRLAAQPEAGAALAELDPWAAANVERLAALEAGWAAAAAGDTLLHCDLRADNMLLAGERVWFVDWPHASLGAAWVDLVMLLPSVALCGPAPDELFAAHRLGRAAPPAAVDAVLAALTGFFLVGSLDPAPPGLPTVRAFQRDQGLAALAWLRRRLGR